MPFSLMNRPCQKHVVVVFVCLIALALECCSFTPSVLRWRHYGNVNNNGNVGGVSGNDGNEPPWTSHRSWRGDWDDEDENYSHMGVLGGWLLASCDDGDNHVQSCHPNATTDDDVDDTMSLRGGSNSKTSQNELLAGSKSTLAKTASYWSNAWKTTSETLATPFRFASAKMRSLFSRPSKADRARLEAVKKLESLPVQAVTVPNSTVLPPEVVSIAAKRAGMIGKPLKYEAVQQLAQTLKQWYTRKGYVLHSVTGATLDTDTATAEIEVEEPIVSNSPVGITYCKEMVIDDETGKLVTYRQYKGRHSKRRTFGHSQIKKSDLNTTFVTTPGRTNPQRIARALQLSPGKPFQWDGSRWQGVLSSGIFGRILNASPQRMKDGTVQFHVVAAERAPRNLEYGITKSLYTGAWEGELDFENANFLGGGEVAGLRVRRGTKDAEPSVKIRFSDNRFGQAGGYDAEVFTDFIGEETTSESNGGDEDITDYDHDALLSRKGATFRLQNPVDPSVIRHTSASASLERTSTRSGHHENLGSATMSVGPFRKDLPFDARSSLMGSFSSGARMPEIQGSNEATAGKSPWNVLPYSSGTATARQVFPFMSDQTDRPVSLALSHTVMTSTRHFPRHEANSAGISANVRGYDLSSNGPVVASLKGTTEIRVPVKLPTNKLRQDASIVLYGDWLYAKSYRGDSDLMHKSSVGVGIRKSVQGIPLKYDVSYTREGKIGAFFGIGRDFDA